MRCEQVREALSARMDGEVAGVAAALLDGHLAGCPDCVSWRDRAERVTQVVRQQSVPAPDLTAAVLAAVARDRAPAGAAPRRTPVARWPVHAVLRVAVVVTAFAQALLAVPVLLGAGDVHASREMACFELAVAVGFALVAWRPAQARVLVPVAVVLAAGLGLTSVFDVVSAGLPWWHEAGHLAVVAQAALLWSLSRAAGPPSPDRIGAGAVTPA
jgi:predicted anti-sigma-YlaC factor YlaD